MILDNSFFLNNDVKFLAKNLIGKILFTNFENKKTYAQIIETEAYDGLSDRACHAYLNKKTKRTKIFFENGGLIYVFLCYGVNFMFNIISGDKKHPNAVLIRALKPIKGLKYMIERRNINNELELCRGPGKLSKAMGINLNHNGLLIGNKIKIFNNIPHKKVIKSFTIEKSTRIGINYAKEAKNLKWRFFIKNCKFVSNNIS